MTAIDYLVAEGTCNGWAVFRNERQIAQRGDLYEAVDFATLLAEREARQTGNRVRVITDMDGLNARQSCGR